MVTKPIIFTYLLLPASRHVILNGLSDPWAGFEPLENMVSQMKLSQETACIRFSGASHLSPISEPLHEFIKSSFPETEKLPLFKDVCIITNSLFLKTSFTAFSVVFMQMRREAAAHEKRISTEGS